MTDKEAKKVLRSIKYRPGWRFILDDAGDVEIRLSTLDAYKRNSYTMVSSWVVDASQIRSLKQLVERVADGIQRLENHEFGEWFKYKGKRIYDPHQ